MKRYSLIKRLKERIHIIAFITKYIGCVSSVLPRLWRFVQRVINVNTISLLIAAIAAFISYRTLNESIVQRETMYRPELYVGETMFYADLTDTAGIKYYSLEKDSVAWNKSVRVPWMRINNVGMGSALHIEGIVDLRLEVLSKAMKAMKMNQKDNDDIYDTYVHGDDTLKLLGGSRIKWYKDYILPLYQTQDECTQELVANGFDNMIKTALWLNRVLDSRFQGFIIPVEFKYKDINEKWYTIKTWMQLQCYTNEDKTGVRCRICSGIAQKEFMDEEQNRSNQRVVL